MPARGGEGPGSAVGLGHSLADFAIYPPAAIVLSGTFIEPPRPEAPLQFITTLRGKADLTKSQNGLRLTVTFDWPPEAFHRGALAKAITAKDIREKLHAEGHPFPEFTFTGNIKSAGEYQIEFVGKFKATILVTVNQTGAKAAPLDEVEEAGPIPEPAPTEAPAPAGALFGTEFTFTNQAMWDDAKSAAQGPSQQKAVASNRRAQADWLVAMRVRMREPDGPKRIEEQGSKSEPVHRFIYADGWWYQTSLDIACVETQTYKMSLADAERHGWLARVQKDIFGVAHRLGLQPHKITGGGHIHLDLQSSFGGSYNLFRNFLVDFANNPLALEALENDPTNAPVIGQFAKSVRKSFFTLIESFDKTNLAHKYSSGTEAIVALADFLQNSVYRDSRKDRPLHEQFDEHGKFHALNVARIADRLNQPGSRTLEIRALRAQRSAQEFVLVARLFQAKLSQLKRLDETNERVPYNPKAKRGAEHSDPALVVAAFRKYVESAGLAFQDYEEMVYANLAERHGDKFRRPPSAAAPPAPGRESSDRPAAAIDPADREAERFISHEAEANRQEADFGRYDARYLISERQQAALKERGLRLTGTTPDGDCIYNGVRESAGLSVSVLQMRKEAVAWCQDRREQIIETHFAGSEPAFERSMREMAEPGKFMGEHGDLGLEAIAGVLGRGLRVLHPDGRVAHIADGSDPILLVYVEHPLPHYYGTTAK